MNTFSHYLHYAETNVSHAIMMALMVGYIGAIGCCGLLLLLRKPSSAFAEKTISPLALYGGITAVLIAVVSYVQYTVNIPYPDDYDLSLEFLVRFDNADSIFDRIRLLLQRHSSHITLFLNLANFLDWKIFGILDLRHMVLLAFLFLLAMTALLQSPLQGEDKNLHRIIVAMLCINTFTYGTTLLPNNSIQNYPILAMTATALFLLAKPGNTRFYLAILILILSTFSAGNGMFGFVAGAIVLISRQAKKDLFIWCGIGALTVFMFFNVFEEHKEYVLATGLEFGFAKLARYFLTFLGSIAQVVPFYGARLAPFAGALMLACCLFLLQKKYYRKNPAITGWIAFMLMTAVVVALTRCGNRFSDALVPRYTINSCVLVALIYVAFIELYGHQLKRLHTVFICFIMLVFTALSLPKTLPAMAERQDRLTAGVARYVKDADPRGLATNNPERVAAILADAAKHNIYHIEAAIGLEAPYKVPPKKIIGVVLTDGE